MSCNYIFSGSVWEDVHSLIDLVSVRGMRVEEEEGDKALGGVDPMPIMARLELLGWGTGVLGYTAAHTVMSRGPALTLAAPRLNGRNMMCFGHRLENKSKK